MKYGVLRTVNMTAIWSLRAASWEQLGLTQHVIAYVFESLNVGMLWSLELMIARFDS